MQNSLDGDYKVLTEIGSIKAEIKGIKKKVGKLRSDYRDLSERFGIQGIQDQLNSLHDSLLETQRMVARLFILYASNSITEVAQRQKPKISSHFIDQLNVDTASATAEANTSDEPLAIASEFVNKACEGAEKLGIKLLMF
jgi:hypothetical protein